MTFDEWLISEGDDYPYSLTSLARAAWEAASKAEREACARVCDDYVLAAFAAAKIRARKEET
jgi:hypothetical protein